MSTWTYSGNPNYSAKDQVRFLVGDTDSRDQLLNDFEITWVLSQYNNTPLNAAIRCCEAIISKMSRMASESVGRVKVEYQQKADSYRKTMLMLENRLAKEDAQPFAGGISIVQKRTNEQNTDRVRPDFRKHMMENDQIAPWTTENFDMFFMGEG